MIAQTKLLVLAGAVAFGAFAVPSLPAPGSAPSPSAAAVLPGSGSAELKHFGEPDEVRTFPKGRVELVKINGVTIGRAIFEPGWRWSTSVMPIAKTKSCEAPHFQYHVYGVLKILMDDGTELECRPGDVSYLPAGHDAWVVGSEPAIVVDFHGMVDYAKSQK
jgi:hypothetical protein